MKRKEEEEEEHDDLSVMIQEVKMTSRKIQFCEHVLSET